MVPRIIAIATVLLGISIATGNKSPMHIPQIMEHVSSMQEAMSEDNHDARTEVQKLTSHLTSVVAFSSLFQEKNYTLSVDCVNQTMEFITTLTSGAPWALASKYNIITFDGKNIFSISVLDAQAKIPSGVLTGNFLWLGNYEQCRAVRAYNSRKDYLFRGKYCQAQIYAAPLQGQALNLGLCLPDACDKDDLHTIVVSELELLKQAVNETPVVTSCQPLDAPSPDAAAVFVISLLSLIAFIVAAATLYDILVYQPHLLTPPDDAFLPQITPPDPSLSEATNNTEVTEQQRSSLDVTDYTPLLNREDMADEHAKFVQSNTSWLLKAFLAFSAYSNGAKLLSTRVKSEGDLGVIHGIRLFSMSWVLLGHSFAFPVTYADNLMQFMSFAREFTFQAIINASVSVDSFFFLSGTLVSYLLLREIAKQEGPRKVSWLKFYFHRYWRLTPTLLLALAFFACVLPFMGHGPLWSPEAMTKPCEGTWWAVPLYINNLYTPSIQCMGWVWYLANDMQFFIISPLLIIPLYWKPAVGVIFNIVVIAISSVSSGVITYIHNFPADFPMFLADPAMAQSDYFNKVYVAPWCRMGVYFIGVLCGFALFKTTTSTFKMHWSLVITGWASAVAMAMSVLYGLLNVSRGHMISWQLNALYSALHREVWALALFWLVFACCRGYGGPVNALLSWRPLVPFSRLTYTAYLVHPMVIFWFLMSRETTMHLTLITLSWFFVANLGMTYAAAVVLSLAIEAPLMALEKIFMR